MLKVVSFDQVLREAKDIALRKIGSGMDADEFIEIGDADGFKIYVAAGKTIHDLKSSMHANPRDVFMLILEGEIEFVLENRERQVVKQGECFVLQVFEASVHIQEAHYRC